MDLARPFGIGTTRRAVALRAMAFDEYFFTWEEGRRHSFYFSHARLPLFVSAAEDYLVGPDGPDRCRFTWRVGITPNTIGRAVQGSAETDAVSPGSRRRRRVPPARS